MTKSIPLKRISFNACYRPYLMKLFGSKAKKKFSNGVVKNDFVINPICEKCRDGK